MGSLSRGNNTRPPAALDLPFRDNHDLDNRESSETSVIHAPKLLNLYVAALKHPDCKQRADSCVFSKSFNLNRKLLKPNKIQLFVLCF